MIMVTVEQVRQEMQEQGVSTRSQEYIEKSVREHVQLIEHEARASSDRSMRFYRRMFMAVAFERWKEKASV